MDTSRIKIGKASFKNRLECFREINFNWKDRIGDDALRIALKRTFFQSWNQEIKIINYFIYSTELLAFYNLFYLMILSSCNTFLNSSA